MSGPVTAETITDEQIRASGADPDDIEHAIAVDPNWSGGRAFWARRHKESRARCATAYNARLEDTP